MREPGASQRRWRIWCQQCCSCSPLSIDSAGVSSDKTIRVAAVVLVDSKQRVLTVRKSGTSRFMQPGGKPEPGEGGAATAVREVREEIGLELAPESLRPMGTFSASAANEPDHTVECENFLVELGPDDDHLLQTLQPAAEIAELRWVPLKDIAADEHLAPLLSDAVAPAVRALLKPMRNPSSR